jgi:hypothetical protein
MGFFTPAGEELAAAVWAALDAAGLKSQYTNEPPAPPRQHR